MAETARLAASLAFAIEQHRTPGRFALAAAPVAVVFQRADDRDARPLHRSGRVAPELLPFLVDAVAAHPRAAGAAGRRGQPVPDRARAGRVLRRRRAAHRPARAGRRGGPHAGGRRGRRGGGAARPGRAAGHRRAARDRAGRAGRRPRRSTPPSSCAGRRPRSREPAPATDAAAGGTVAPMDTVHPLLRRMQREALEDPSAFWLAEARTLPWFRAARAGAWTGRRRPSAGSPTGRRTSPGPASTAGSTPAGPGTRR